MPKSATMKKPLPAVKSKPQAKKVVLKQVKLSKKPVAKAVKSVKKPVAKVKAKAPVLKAVKKQPVKAQQVKAVAKKPQIKAVVKSTVKPVVKQVTPVKPAVKAVAPAQKQEAVKLVKVQKPTKQEYKVGVHVVYPTHGVGKIIAEETQKVGDVELRLFVIAFDKDKMTLRVPVHRAQAAGLRHISSNDDMEKAFSTLKGRARTSRGMWSRRAQEYEAKINSGSLISVAEVVRDLHRNVDQSERSYSERMIYESAFSRLVGELAAAEKLDSKTATDKLIKVLKTQVAA